MLFDYIKSVQRLIRDPRQGVIDPENLTDYINRARREVSMRAQCIRQLTPISGSVVSCTVTAGGSNYTSEATAVITAPDFPSGMAPKPLGDQATATPIIQGGVIVAVDINYGGYGYYQPTISFVDTAGSGATATLTVSPIMTLIEGQEQYPLSSIDLSMFPGVKQGSMYAVQSIAILYSNWRYTLAVPSFSSYQASLRSFPYQYSYVPFYAAQYGRGTKATLFFYPLPAGPWQAEIDGFCLPQDLIDDQSVEVLPEPYTDAVPWLAAFYAYNELQNWNAAKYYEGQFDKWMNRYGVATLPGRVSNPYGRPYW